MRKPIIAAVIQMCSTADKAANYQQAETLLVAAAEANARLVVLPEMFNCLTDQSDMLRQAEPLFGPTSARLATWAKQFGITLVGGSFFERTAAGNVHNTSLVYDSRGELVSCYRKLHLFDVDIPGQVTFRESDFITAGDEFRAPRTEAGHLGQSICYDLRFPELYRRLTDRGAEIIVVPSAFAAATGRAHWEVLLRARAIENQAFVLAANQCGVHSAALATWGGSIMLDPWGGILGKCPTADDVSSPTPPTGKGLLTPAPAVGLITAQLDPQMLESVRASLPVLRHRRGVERWPSA